MERRLRAHLPHGKFRNVSAVDSARMKAVRGKRNRSTELRFRAALTRHAVRGWRLRPSGVTGNPDFMFEREGIAVFLDGCFWHGCADCGHYPKANAGFWRAKIERNRERDAATSARLREQGLTVLRFWEHELANDLRACTRRVVDHVDAARRRSVTDEQVERSARARTRAQGQ